MHVLSLRCLERPVVSNRCNLGMSSWGGLCTELMTYFWLFKYKNGQHEKQL
jgi:hypothetical protein